jgi:hypothetical protein
LFLFCRARKTKKQPDEEGYDPYDFESMSEEEPDGKSFIHLSTLFIGLRKGKGLGVADIPLPSLFIYSSVHSSIYPRARH